MGLVGVGRGGGESGSDFEKKISELEKDDEIRSYFQPGQRGIKVLKEVRGREMERRDAREKKKKKRTREGREGRTWKWKKKIDRWRG